MSLTQAHPVSQWYCWAHTLFCPMSTLVSQDRSQHALLPFFPPVSFAHERIFIEKMGIWEMPLFLVVGTWRRGNGRKSSQAPPHPPQLVGGWGRGCQVSWGFPGQTEAAS